MNFSDALALVYGTGSIYDLSKIEVLESASRLEIRSKNRQIFNAIKDDLLHTLKLEEQNIEFNKENQNYFKIIINNTALIDIFKKHVNQEFVPQN